MEQHTQIAKDSNDNSILENADVSENQIITCVICHGDGYSILEQGKYLCDNCEGKGKYPADKFTKEQAELDKCPNCNEGICGGFSDDDEFCSQCDGTGQIEALKETSYITDAKIQRMPNNRSCIVTTETDMAGLLFSIGRNTIRAGCIIGYKGKKAMYEIDTYVYFQTQKEKSTADNVEIDPTQCRVAEALCDVDYCDTYSHGQRVAIDRQVKSYMETHFGQCWNCHDRKKEVAN